MFFKSELLPHPEPPRITKTSPRRTWKVRSFWMTFGPYAIVTSSTSMTVGAGGAALIRAARR